MLEIFQYSFMVRAFIAGVIISITAPLIGTFLVAKRYALFADTLAHVSLAGVAIGLLIGIHPVIAALFTAVIAAVSMEYLRKNNNLSAETTLAMFLSGGLAVAIVIIGVSRGFNVDIFSYLFGSITTVSGTDLWIIATLGILVSAIVYFLYKELLYLVFHEEMATVSGVPAQKLNFTLIVLTAITVVASIRIVGALLIGALMVIPVVTATQLARSFKHVLLFSIGISLAVVILGLFLAYYYNLPAGGAIVLLSLIFFGVAAFFSKRK